MSTQPKWSNQVWSAESAPNQLATELNLPENLTPLRITADGQNLVLVSETGEEFQISISNRLNQLLPNRPTETELSQPKSPPEKPKVAAMESSLRPKDIQTRIRAGESVADVAQLAGTSVEYINIYADPILAERQHLANLAQKFSVRRRNPDSTNRCLGDVIAATLRGVGINPTKNSWDTWRNEDTSWTLVTKFERNNTVLEATFRLDQRGKFVIPTNHAAHWLVGDSNLDLTGSADFGEDAVALVKATPVINFPEPRTVSSILASAETQPAINNLENSNKVAAHTDLPNRIPATQENPQDVLFGTDLKPQVDEITSTNNHKAKNKKRNSMPSWDEIMFGKTEDN